MKIRRMYRTILFFNCIFQVCGKTGVPKNVLGKSGLTQSALKKLDRMNNEASNVSFKTKGGSETDDGKS